MQAVAHMQVAGRRGQGIALSRGLGALMCLLLLSACQSREDRVRAQLDGWFALGRTLYFDANLQCAAGVFALRSARIVADLDTARSAPEALGLIGLGRPFALHFSGLTVSDISQRMQELDFVAGARILNAGTAARTCLTQDMADRYVQALLRPNGTFIFDPVTNAVAIIDGQAALVFYSRGASG
jgi:hypothetical protein